MTTRQVAITIIAPVPGASVDALEATLSRIAPDPANGPIPFGKLEGVHFARLVLMPNSDGAGSASPRSLALLLDCDAPQRTRLRQLVGAAGPGLDEVFQHCDGYPSRDARTPESRLAYLRAHVAPTAACYVNTIGRTVAQVRQESLLREEIEQFLDRPEHEWPGKSARQARAAIQQFIRGREDLRWARKPVPAPGLLYRAREAAHFAAGALLLLAFSPFVVIGALPYLFVLRQRERSDSARRLTPSDAHIAELAAVEDLLPQNQFTAVGDLKPGAFRLYTAVAVLWLVNFGARHIFNHANLAGVKTIHAARWVFLDGRRRMVFVSNYDGSLENYMDDFIDKVSWGLNAVFSNGVDYPRTNWLIRDGAKDEQAFKSHIRSRQAPTQVWYTAYGHLTALNIENNARIRAGLSGPMDEAAAVAWLRRL
ncbi:MAG: hypothetical protein HYX53_18620 [Chloroflexi bacterium]|nr:hypothetical protein [Chloroflexota bacterium]